jgi:hypothetical protein
MLHSHFFLPVEGPRSTALAEPRIDRETALVIGAE